MLGLLVVCKIPYSKLYFEYSSCSCLSYEYLLMVSPDVVDIGSEYFVVCRAYVYVGLVMPSYLFFCIYFDAWYINCPKREEALEFTYRVIGEVLVLGLLVVYKIPYSSCM